MIYKEKQRLCSVTGYLDMVGVVGSNPIAPTKFGRIKKALIGNVECFFLACMIPLCVLNH